MTVRVDKLTTELAVENGQTPQPSSPSTQAPGWAERDNVRRIQDALARECARTAAEGFNA